MGGVSTRSLYLEPKAAPRAGTQCEVLTVGALLRQLLLESLDIPAEYDLRGRDGVLMRLLLLEVARASTLPLFAPLPREPRLAALCLGFLQQPQVHVSPRDWAAQLHKSERSFSRLFRQQTGMSFADWRQQACLLAEGRPVTAVAVALELGYDSPGAFSTMFRKRLGRAPSAFVRGRSSGTRCRRLTLVPQPLASGGCQLGRFYGKACVAPG